MLKKTDRKGNYMKNQKKFNTTKMVQLAVLIAIIFVMAFTPLGYIKTPLIDMTLIVVPVAVGAVVLGPLAGAILGFTFGLTSLILSFSSPLGAMMTDINPAFRVITCIVPRVLCGWLAGLVYVAMKKGKKTQKLSVFFGNLACPVLNTILFMSTMMLFYYNTPTVQAWASEEGYGSILAVVVAIVGINGLVEAIACVIIGSALTKALQVALKLKS